MTAGLHPAPGAQHAAQPNLQLLEPLGRGQQGTAQQQQQQQQQQQPQEEEEAAFFDYCNGGPVFLAPDGSTELGELPGVQVLATFKELHGAAAALRCGPGQPGAPSPACGWSR